MTDLNFIVVNSNLQHAQVLLHELESRVSFEVYQDTQEKNIWKLMDGGKDDLYVYDRCGRLAYYIPFPLSIMNAEEGLVPSAILATYYRSPCGDSCDKNSSTSLEDFLNNVDDAESPVEYTEVTTTPFDVINETFTPVNYDDNDNVTNNTFEINTNQIFTNNSDQYSSDDFDYAVYNDTTEDYDNNETDTDVSNRFYNTLYRLFFNAESEQTTTIVDENLTLYPTDPPNIAINNSNEILPIVAEDRTLEELNFTETTFIDEVMPLKPKPKSDRCAEADMAVCRNWSKKRLLRAHTCCSSGDSNGDRQRTCKNFGSKRCKKIKTVLKCCIKTAIVDSTSEATDSSTPPTTIQDGGSDQTTIEEQVEGVTTQPEVNHTLICCKDMDEGRRCRVSFTSTCNDDEYASDVENHPDSATLEETK